MPRNLDPRAQAAIDHIRAHGHDLYVGPILVRNLVRIVPKRGYRRTYGDAVTVFLLAHLIGVYRLDEGEVPFWSDHLYRLRRTDLAKEWCCEPDDVSASVQWLVSLGLADAPHRTHIDDVGKPAGTIVYAFPRMDRIKAALDFLTAKGRPMTASELMDSDPLQGGSNSPSKGSQVPVNDAPSPLKAAPILTAPNRNRSSLIAAASLRRSGQNEQWRTTDKDEPVLEAAMPPTKIRKMPLQVPTLAQLRPCLRPRRTTRINRALARILRQRPLRLRRVGRHPLPPRL